MSHKKSLARIEQQLGIGDDAPSDVAKTKVVGPKTFIEDPGFMNAKDELYPEVLAAFIELNSGGYSEAILTGGIGCGKTELGTRTIAYQLYLLAEMESPQVEFGLASSSEIIFIIQSVNADLAKNVDFIRFRQMIYRSPYFQKRFHYHKASDTELRFPKGIVVRAVSGLATAALGQNVIGGVIDEVNFMAVVDRSRMSVDGATYDQARDVYNSLSRRRQTRFMRNGKVAGILCVVSSRRYPGQFTDQMERERHRQLNDRGATSIYLYDKRVWDVKPEGTYCGKTFNVFIGDVARKPRVLLPKETISEAVDDLVIPVPVEHQDEFESDLINALRDLAGIATLATNPFFTNPSAVVACFGTHESILDRDAVTWPQENLSVYRANFHHPELFRSAHIDLSLSHDATGIVVGHVSRFEEVDRNGTPEMLPRIYIDCVLRVLPPKDGEIPYDVVREFIYTLRESGLNLAFVSADSYQSASMIQQFRRQGFTADQVSVDRNSTPYEVLKSALYDGRIDLPSHDVLLHELTHLECDAKTRKIDHPPHGSKDLADALAGVVYGLSRCGYVWHQHDVNPWAAPSHLSLLSETQPHGPEAV